MQPSPFTSNTTSDSLASMAAGATLFVLLMGLLYVALLLYLLVMPLMIYLRLGRIARAVEANGTGQSNAFTEIRELAACHRKLTSDVSVHTTILKSLDQNLALGVNEIFQNRPPAS